jgi:hypothetical protein
MIGVSRQTILSDRTDKPRFIKDTFPFVIVVALLAAAIIVAFSVVSISLLYTSEETLKGSRIGDSPLEDKVINTAVSHRNRNASSVQVQTKSPSSNDADNMPSATAVLPPSNMPREETVAEPALKLTPDRVVGGPAIEASHASAPDPPTDETGPSELIGSHEVSAQSASTVGAASAAEQAADALSVQVLTKSPSSNDADNTPSATQVPPASDIPGKETVAEPDLKLTPDKVVGSPAIEASHGSAPDPPADETRPSELSGSHEVSAQSASTVGTASAAEQAGDVSSVQVQTKSPSSTDPDNMPSAAQIPPASDIPGKETVAEPDLKLTPDRVVGGPAIGASHGSAPDPPVDERRPSELSGSHEVSAQSASTTGTPSADEHASEVTMPTSAISDEQRVLMFRDFEIRRNRYTNFDQGTAATVYGATPSRGSPPLRPVTSHHQAAAETDHKVAEKLNRVELSRLLKLSRLVKGSRAPLR